MSTTHYYFHSSLRQGLAASINQPIAGERAEIKLQLHPARRKKATGDWDDALEPLSGVVQLYGPGDIVTFDDRIVSRREPLPNSGNYEPNYFPAIEFADPDFPWRFTPEPMAAGGSSQPAEVVALTPWITLIVLIAEDRGDSIRREFEELPRGRNQRPAVRVYRQENLPDLRTAWHWAHVQTTSGDAHLDDEILKDLMKNAPERVISRLLCTRRLQPKTLYRAMVVPTYKSGWAAALDTPEARAIAENISPLDLTWNNESADPVVLPYYDSWEFRTSQRGDFEFLVRLLEARKLDELGLGKRDIMCDRPGFGLSVTRKGVEDKDKHRLEMEGALQSIGTKYTPWARDKDNPSVEEFQKQLAEEVINRANLKPQKSTIGVIQKAKV